MDHFVLYWPIRLVFMELCILNKESFDCRLKHGKGRCFGSPYNFDRHLWSPAKLFTFLFENIRCAYFGSLRRKIHVFVTPTKKNEAKILKKQHRSQLKYPNKAKKRYYPWGNHTYFKIFRGACSRSPYKLTPSALVAWRPLHPIRDFKI